MILRLILIAPIGLWLFVGSALSQLTPSGKDSALTAIRYEVRSNVTYLKTDKQDLKMDIYLPLEFNGKRPTLIWFHGGGWTRSSKEEEVLYVLPYLEAGWTVVNVEYRLANKALAPAAVEDCQCALRWIAANAKSQKINTETVVLSGISAGGHLALSAALLPAPNELDTRCLLTGSSLNIAGVINWFGPSDITELLAGSHAFDQAMIWVGSRPDRLEIARRVSPVNFVDKADPPVITVHGDRDEIIPHRQSVRLHAALDKAGVPNRLVTFRGRGHGDFDEQQTLRAYREIRRFLIENKILSIR